MGIWILNYADCIEFCCYCYLLPYQLKSIKVIIKIFQALSLIGDRRNKEAAERLEKEKELQKVSVKKEDIELIVSKYLYTFQYSPTKTNNNYSWKCHLENMYQFLYIVLHYFLYGLYFCICNLIICMLQVKEMEISRILAERTLREHRGDVVAALTTLTN